jgi:anhydro-N-acetylmuramic acid kinase
MLAIGLMSGTSLDGLDGCIASIEPTASGVTVETRAFVSHAFPQALQQELQALQAPCNDELNRAYLASNDLAHAYARVIADLLAAASLPSSDISIVGAHGQTIRHRPELGFTAQLLNGALLAELSGIDVAFDFRSADVAAGGQGAPLAPGFHQQVFANQTRDRTILNIGGIANVSQLHADHSPPIGFDTGPGNTLMDYWCLRHQQQPFDRDGAWAKQGFVSQALLGEMLSEPYFALAKPKSTGRDLFNASWLGKILASSQKFQALTAADVQATLLELTAQTIALALNPNDVFVCGGGAKNGALMARLAALHPSHTIKSTQALGVDPQSVEALAFAWLGYKRILCEPANWPSVTSAKGARVLGALHKASA